MLVYSQKTGRLTLDGKPFALAYSGHGKGLNNHSMETIHAIGPIPCGIYRMVELRQNGSTGPNSIALIPEPETDTHGRGDFLYHGDNRQANFTASHGCIVSLQGSAPRLRAWNLSDKRINVVPE